MEKIKLQPLGNENYSSPQGVAYIARILYSLPDELRVLAIHGGQTGELPAEMQSMRFSCRRHIETKVSERQQLEVLGMSIEITRVNGLGVYEARSIEGRLIGTHRDREELLKIIWRSRLKEEIKTSLCETKPDLKKITKLKVLLDHYE